MIRRMSVPLLVGLIGVAILVSLGVWQLRRLEWKTAILAEIDARLAAAAGRRAGGAPTRSPTATAGCAPRASSCPARSTSTPPVPAAGSATGSIAPLALADGRRILLDRGFVPIGQKDAPRPPGPVDVVGNLVWPQEGAGATRPGEATSGSPATCR